MGRGGRGQGQVGTSRREERGVETPRWKAKTPRSQKLREASLSLLSDWPPGAKRLIARGFNPSFPTAFFSRYFRLLPRRRDLKGYQTMNRLRVSKHLRGALSAVAACLAPVLFTGCLHSGAQNTAGRGQGRGLLFATFDLSPDGKTILFAGAGNGGSDLYLLNLKTNKVTQLTDTPDYEAYPAFSPDGKTIVYQCTKAEGADQSRHLFLRSLDGKQVRQLTKTPASDDQSPRFSPDGDKIVFSRVSQYQAVSPQQSTGSGFDVFVVNRNGTGLTQVTHLNCDGVMRPRFYPDSRHILFEETTTTGAAASVGMHLARADVTGEQPVQKVVKFRRYGR